MDCLTSRILLQIRLQLQMSVLHQSMCIFKAGLSSSYDCWAKYKEKVPDVSDPNQNVETTCNSKFIPFLMTMVLPNVKLRWEINWKILVIKILLKFTTLQKEWTFDQDKSTREAINDICNDVAIDTTAFTTQDLVIKAISDYADKKHTTTWHKALSTLPTNIYSFFIRYLT